MIRFSCPQCSRPYELPNALTGLPLLCKGCGNRLAVPDPQPDPAPAAARTPEPPPPAAPPPREPEPAAAARPPAKPPEPPPPPAVVPPPPAGSRLVPVVVDVAAAVALFGAGWFAGEWVAKKPAGQIISGAMTSPKFPPTDLVLWAAGPVLAVLLAVWLGGRGWTPGGWLRRRAGG